MGEQFIDNQINFNQWYNFFKAMILLNSYNFNASTWLATCKKGKFGIEEDIYTEEQYYSKSIIHKYFVQDRIPLGVSNKFVTILYAELRKYKNGNTRKEAEEVINYIIKVATNAFPDERFMILRMAIIAFRDEKKRVEDVAKGSKGKWTKLITKFFLAVDCPEDTAEQIRIAKKKTGEFYLDIIKRPYKDAIGEYGKKAK
jgi:hypothetical protein